MSEQDERWKAIQEASEWKEVDCATSRKRIAGGWIYKLKNRMNVDYQHGGIKGFASVDGYNHVFVPCPATSEGGENE